MIVVDTSALMAIVLGEPDGVACMDCLADADELVISAGTLSEFFIVADRRGRRTDAERLIAGLGVEIVAVQSGDAKQIADAYSQWGKGVHKAGLNFGDCFAYALARSSGEPLLCKGDDFVHTDIVVRRPVKI